MIEYVHKSDDTVCERGLVTGADPNITCLAHRRLVYLRVPSYVSEGTSLVDQAAQASRDEVADREDFDIRLNLLKLAVHQAAASAAAQYGFDQIDVQISVRKPLPPEQITLTIVKTKT